MQWIETVNFIASRFVHADVDRFILLLYLIIVMNKRQLENPDYNGYSELLRMNLYGCCGHFSFLKKLMNVAAPNTYKCCYLLPEFENQGERRSNTLFLAECSQKIRGFR